ncbi:hypothetical protein CHS0354_036566 [Potamilus streckersoni]|uniref:Phosphate transporter n=1 Tax=Potamilus streckersoni TaxID=2493646 RepID=A0AAE0RR88_9BIVA|nr:hypothetical protein CHS0354_036566 [Potamilus streckersoni]
MIMIPEECLWMIIVGFIIAFILAFGIGANDVANSFGTSVGSKVLTWRKACILATIFEILGAVLIGARVSDTIRKGIITVDAFNDTEQVFMAGNVAALSGSCIWLLVATFFKLPVSGTHSIVGATIGFSLVAHGLQGVQWAKLGMIVGSWFVSPISAGLVSAGLFLFVNHFVLKKDQPLSNGLKLLPLFYAVTLAVNLFSVFYEGSELLHFNKIPLYGVFILTFGPTIIVAIVVRLVLVPYQRRTIQAQLLKDNPECEVLAKQKDEEEGGVNFTTALRRGLRAISECEEPSSESPIGEEVVVVLNKCSMENEEKNNNENKGDSRETTPSLHVKEVSKEQMVLGTKTPGGLSMASSFGTASVSSSMPLLPIDIKVDDTQTPLIKENTYTNNVTGSFESSTTDISANSLETGISAERRHARQLVHDKPETAKLFSFLQILTAVFGSFAHGGNDVSNCIGPVVALWVTATTGNVAQKVPVPIWILVYGGVGISLGLWVWGSKVMKTMGEDLTKITPSSGFCIELGSALTVLVASNVGIPISTTHCKVGSVVCVGFVRSKQSVDWTLFRNIILAWFVTVPASGLLSAAFMAIFMKIV